MPIVSLIPLSLALTLYVSTGDKSGIDLSEDATCPILRIAECVNRDGIHGGGDALLYNGAINRLP